MELDRRQVLFTVDRKGACGSWTFRGRIAGMSSVDAIADRASQTGQHRNEPCRRRRDRARRPAGCRSVGTPTRYNMARQSSRRVRSSQKTRLVRARHELGSALVRQAIMSAPATKTRSNDPFGSGNWPSRYFGAMNTTGPCPALPLRNRDCAWWCFFRWRRGRGTCRIRRQARGC